MNCRSGLWDVSFSILITCPCERRSTLSHNDCCGPPCSVPHSLIPFLSKGPVIRYGIHCVKYGESIASSEVESPMKTFVLTLITLTTSLLQQSEPVVSKDSISIHTVRRGNMRLRVILAGAIASIEPAK